MFVTVLLFKESSSASVMLQPKWYPIAMLRVQDIPKAVMGLHGNVSLIGLLCKEAVTPASQ